MHRKINSALIGCGAIGFFNDFHSHKKGTFSHFKSMYKSDLFNLLAIMDKDQKKLNIINKKYGINTYKNYFSMLSENKVDLIVIATPDKTHIKILKEIISFKPKIVLCEKPISNNLRDIKKIISLYKKNKIHLLVNYSFRFNSDFNKIKEILDSKKLGKTFKLNATYSRGYFHNACHYIDFALWLFGEPKTIEVIDSHKSKSYQEDYTVSVNLKYNNNLNVQISGVDLDNIDSTGLSIVCEKGIIIVNPIDEIKIFKIRKNRHQPSENEFYLASNKKINYGNSMLCHYKNIHDLFHNKVNAISPIKGLVDIARINEKVKKLI